MQELAIDQVRFEQTLPLQTLMAYSDKNEVLNLTEKVNKEGKLNWQAPAGNWTLYAIFQGFHGKMVERAGPGGEGDVIDHFSSKAIKNYLSAFDKAFAKSDVSSMRAFFNDSYEVDDARGQADWTEALLDEFKIVEVTTFVIIYLIFLAKKIPTSITVFCLITEPQSAI